jgi:hypothetical protein
MISLNLMTLNLPRGRNRTGQCFSKMSNTYGFKPIAIKY